MDAPLLRSLEALGGEYVAFAGWLGRCLSVPVAMAASPPSAPPVSARVHPSVVARRFDGMGVGLAAEGAGIAAGEVILRLPRAAWYPVSAARAAAVAGENVPRFVAHAEAVSRELGAPDLAKHALLALHILFELGGDGSDAAGAELGGPKPYLATLPPLAGRAAPSVPLLWAPRQLASLRGTPTHAAALDRSRFVAAAHAALFPGGNGVPLDAFAWALSSVLSRAASGVGMPYTLMPGVDLLNHGGASANCALGATRREGFGGSDGDGDGDAFEDIEVRCTRDVAPGEQLTISYGDGADNDRLLRLYGFAVPGNPNDRVELELRVAGLAEACWTMTKTYGPGLTMARQAILRMHGLPRLDPFDEEDDPSPEEMMRELIRSMGVKDEEITDEFVQDFKQAMETMEAEQVGKRPKKSPAFRDPDLPGAVQTPGEKKTKTKAGAGAGDHGHGHSHGGVECQASHGHSHGNDSDESDGGGTAAGKSASAARTPPKGPPVWRCYVAHPAKTFPPRRRPLDSSTEAAQAASDAATSLAAGAGGGAVSLETLVATLRVHLLRGDEPPGPDGHEPDPWAPVSEENEAAVSAVLVAAAERALGDMEAALEARPHGGGGEAAGGSAGRGEGEEGLTEEHGHPSSDRPALEPLDEEEAAAVREELRSGEAWAAAVVTLRRGRRDILEHVMRRARGECGR